MADSLAALRDDIRNGDGSKREWSITTPQHLSICSGYLMKNGCYETQFQMEGITACSKLLLRNFPGVSGRIHCVFDLSVNVLREAMYIRLI